MKSSTKIVLMLSLFLLTSDFMMILINYYGSKRSLENNAIRLGEAATSTFHREMESTITKMQMLATYISKNPLVVETFKEGRDAVLAEGGGPGKSLSNTKRQELLRLVNPSWKLMTEQFEVRQLHFHLGPGSLSFLRVHRPEKFGDRMDQVRYTVVDVNQYGNMVGGFETGRVYSGIRGVVPVIDSETNPDNPELIGALEAGTSFSLLLEVLKKELHAELAVFLTRDHIEKNVWPEFQKKFYGEGPIYNFHYLEACTCKENKKLLTNENINQNLNSSVTKIIKVDQSHYAVTFIPLIDYLGSVNTDMPPVGTVVIYQPYDDEYGAFLTGFRINLTFGIIGLIIAELLIIFAVRIISSSLQRTIDIQTIDLSNALKRLEAARENEIAAEKLKTANKLAATIAHEFNNPLAIIQGNCDLYLNSNDKNDQYTGPVETILKQVKRMNRNVQNLLNLEKLEEQHYAGKLTIYDLSESSSMAEADKDLFPDETQQDS